MNCAIFLAGGVGSRLQWEIPKQYVMVAGKLLVTYSLETLCRHPGIDTVLVVAEYKWRECIEKDLKKYVVTNKLCGFADPGLNRQLSILNALNEIKHNWNAVVDNILIHDAARPNLSEKQITECMRVLEEHDGVMPTLPMKDTVYLCEGTSVSSLLDRSKVFVGQAPEAYKFDKYYEANRRLQPSDLSMINGSTEPAIMAELDVVTIPGDEHNYKITTPQDLKRFIVEKEQRL